MKERLKVKLKHLEIERGWQRGLPKEKSSVILKDLWKHWVIVKDWRKAKH